MVKGRTPVGSKAISGTYGVSAVERVISILRSFSQARPELSLPEIEKATGLHKSTSFRLLENLIQGGLVGRDESSGAYRLGLGLLPLVEVAKASFSVVGYARPIMRRIQEELNETCFLSIRVGDHRTDIEQLVGLRELRRVVELGIPKPLNSGPASKVLLSAMTNDEFENYLSRLKRSASPTIRDTEITELRQERKKIQKRRYADGVSKFSTGGWGVASLIQTPLSDSIAALCMTIPLSRSDAKTRASAIQKICAGAAEISQRIFAEIPISK